EAKRDEVAELAEEVLGSKKLASGPEVMGPIAAHSPDAIRERVAAVRSSVPSDGDSGTSADEIAAGERAAGDRVTDGGVADSSAYSKPLTVAQSINAALAEQLSADDR